MTNRVTVLFFGSFLHYSAYVLQALLNTPNLEVIGVVTTPPLVDKKGEHKNPVHLLAENNNVPVFTPNTLDDAALNDILLSRIAHHNEISLFLTAGYGKLLPSSWLQTPTIASLNLHLSVLPDYRGANPGEWALLMGEHKSGITLMEMSAKFDTGNIIATYTLPVSTTENRETLYDKLYSKGAQVLSSLLQAYIDFKSGSQDNATKLHIQDLNATVLHLPPIEQPLNGYIYARRLKREDGFISWAALEAAMKGNAVGEKYVPTLYKELQTLLINDQLPITEYIERATRALAGFPSLWTEIQTKNGITRMKILDVSIENKKLILEKVHIAGKQPARWNEVKNVLAE